MDTELRKIREAMGHLSMDWTPNLWLDTGIPDLNMVMGHRNKGIPYGRIIEMAGLESHGKTAIAMSLAAVAQQNGALIVWGDLENSFEPDWALQRGMAKCPTCAGSGRDLKTNKACKICGDPKIKCSSCTGAGCPECFDTGEAHGRGLDPDLLMLVQPYVGRFEETFMEKGFKKKRTSPARLSTGTELCAEIEQCATFGHKKRDRMWIVVDSLASILTDGEAAAGIEGQNMRTNMDLPMFLGKLLRRWVGLAQVYNATILLTNQLRQNPSQRFGSSWYAPGGNAPRFYSHVRARVMRVKGGKIEERSAGKVTLVGIQGAMTAVKNKTGGLEGSKVGYKVMFNGPVEFLPVKDIKTKDAEEME